MTDAGRDAGAAGRYAALLCETRRFAPRPLRKQADGDGSTSDWNLVVRSDGRPAGAAREALVRLLGHFWNPLYAYFRRRGHDRGDARALTRGLVQSLMESDVARGPAPENVRFRSFLLTAARSRESAEWRGLLARGRDEGAIPFPLDVDSEEEGCPGGAAPEPTAERAFERRWVMALLERAIQTMATEAQAQGDGVLFEKLKPHLTHDDASTPCAGIAAELGIPADAVMAAARRMRRRFAQALRAEVLRTLRDPSDLEDEIRHLFSLFE